MDIDDVKYYNILVDIYHHRIHFIVGNSKQALKVLEHKASKANVLELKDKDMSLYDGYYYLLPNGESYIWVREGLDYKDFLRTVIHESLHATFSILDIVGIQLSAKSEEAFTYLHEHIASALIWDDEENENIE